MVYSKQLHCCSNMDYYSTSPREEHELVRYHSETRNYHFILHGNNLGMEQEMYYCPWCGAKLPKSLSEEWCKVIKENFGLDDVFAQEWAELPEEFKTEEWWKKRGL
ncbi:DUF6980 family protein [Candidatus Trichorickettsia mobilis]|uniref:DUF6980 family protein n=1 Tax=Candidatus Trichorickettsia mobilis TaxID=1346319 RepID=UPI00292F83F2|nr:hypothetical protein [Candidatus Trichorickettsia mobilis]